MSTAAVQDARKQAEALDNEDPIAFIRDEFNIPTKAQIASSRLADSHPGLIANHEQEMMSR